MDVHEPLPVDAPRVRLVMADGTDVPMDEDTAARLSYLAQNLLETRTDSSRSA